MDNFQYEDAITNSAGEYVFVSTDGGHVIVTDEANGMGFAKIAPYDGELCANPFGGDLAGASSLALSLPIALAMFTFF